MIRYAIFMLAVMSLCHPVFAKEPVQNKALSLPVGKPGFQSGKWSTAEINGVQWLIDPEGKPFYSKGVISSLPARRVKRAGLGRHIAGRISTLRSRNGATRSEPRSGNGDSIPWADGPTVRPISDCLSWWTWNSAGIRDFHWFDPFDPQMEQKTLEKARELTAPYRDLPQLIGYFSDNEVGWWNLLAFHLVFAVRPGKTTQNASCGK